MALLLFCAAASCGGEKKSPNRDAFVVGGVLLHTYAKSKSFADVKCSSGVGSEYIIIVLNVVVSSGFVSPCKREHDPEQSQIRCVRISPALRIQSLQIRD